MNVLLERRFSFAVFPHLTVPSPVPLIPHHTYSRALLLRPDLRGTKATAVPQVDFSAELVELFSTLS